ncbi:MAG: LemA family protein [Rhodoferax sp.]|nr:LemA family protein [Rhodoferax sp.]
MLNWLLLSITIFWCVGLYNRLMRLRARAQEALGSVEKNLCTYTRLLDAQFPHEEGCYIPLEWAALVAAVKQLEGQCKEARQARLQAAPLAALALSVDAVEREWMLLCKLPADLAGPLMPEAMQKSMDEAALQVRSARRGFNQIVERYNQALHQFPSSLVVSVLGFKPAGTL